MKIKRILLILTSLLLVSCNQRDVTFDRTYPDTAELDELKQELETARLNSEEFMKYKHLIDTNIKPPTYNLYLPREDRSVELVPLLFCWKQTVEQCNQLTYDSVLDNRNIYIDTIQVNRRVPIEIQTLTNHDELPAVSHLEMAQFTEDHLSSSFSYGKIDEFTYFLESPLEKNTYTVVIKAYYEQGIGGIALYAFKMTVGSN